MDSNLGWSQLRAAESFRVQGDCEMAQPLDDEAQTRLGIAALAAAFAQTLGEQDDTFVRRLDEQLERIYRAMEDHPGSPIGALEMLTWTHEMLRP